MVRLLSLLLLVAAALAAAPAPAPAVEPGLVIGGRIGAPNNVDEVSKADESGARWVRIFVNWHTIEPAADDVYDAYVLDGIKHRVTRHAADGTRVLLVISMAPKWANGSDDPTVPPKDPREYGEFAAFLTGELKGKVHAIEVWNEPNDGDHAGGFYFGPPDPAGYTQLLKATYPAVKAVDPGVTVLVGGLVANDHRFVEGIMAAGGADAFDAVGVHTDTACLTSPPDEFYREPDGRIGTYSFTGYREIHAITGKPIWITEMGWSTTPAICRRGRVGQKPGGVTEAQQAEYLTAAYACLQTDPFVAVALWFSMQDVGPSDVDDHRLGLLRNDGSAKPAWTALRSWLITRPARRCGAEVDREAPRVHIVAPRAGQQWLDTLQIHATATDGGTGVRRMQLFADGVKVPGTQDGGTFRLEWNGAKQLSVGRHTLTVKAFDRAANVGQSSVDVVKDLAGNIRVGQARLTFKARRRAGGRVTVSGRVSAARTEPVRPKGRVRVLMEYRKGARWVLYSRYTKGIARPFSFTVALKKPGRWRIHARFAAEKPYAPVKSAYHLVTR